MRNFPRAAAVLALALVSALSALALTLSPAAAQAGKTVTNSLGLQMTDTKVGAGAEAKKGQLVVVHYTGWLYNNGAKGAKFDSSLDRGQPFMFTLGKGEVIQGWDDGVKGMKVGGKRTLVIPPAIAYGTRGAGNSIPPNATLIFEVELLDVKG
jgi:FKBP-type peptidyl-prolyl cis-trans isomerase FkpA